PARSPTGNQCFVRRARKPRGHSSRGACPGPGPPGSAFRWRGALSMRFDAITLQRYGIFADFTLDLSQGSEGIHLIFGGNEAGKSTTLRALHRMLFGFPQRKDDFLDDGDPRVGGVVRHGEQTL